ncbi:MAG: energy-coupling factor transporter transmembrane component T family protein, partial [Acutalibacteraceae bacterium]
RGADFESGKLFERVKAMIPILIPLFVSAFNRAYELAFAMSCRCYRGGEGRTRMKQPKMKAADYLILLLFVLIMVGVILLNHFFGKIV